MAIIAAIAAGSYTHTLAYIAIDLDRQTLYAQWIGNLATWVLFHIFKRIKHGNGYFGKEHSSYYRKDVFGKIKIKWSAVFVPIQRTILELLKLLCLTKTYIYTDLAGMSRDSIASYANVAIIFTAFAFFYKYG